MKRTIFVIILLMSFFSNLWSQAYDSLWKKVDKAEHDDQPRTQISILSQIQERAAQENAYGHLLASTLRRASLEYEISPDSLSTWLTKLKAMEHQTTDRALQAIYDAVLYRIYCSHPSLDDSKEKADNYRVKALSHPDLLAQTTVDSYAPFIKKGIDSKLFGNDLLHVIGFETDQLHPLYDWYYNHGNREAACFLATELAAGNIQQLDSIIHDYQDLLVCGHAAIARLEAMSSSTNEEVKAAYDYATQALSRWGAWQEMNAIRNTQANLTYPTFRFYLKDVLYHPLQQPKVVFKDVRNLSEMRVRILSTRLTNDHKKLRSLGVPVDDDYYKSIRPYIDDTSAQTFSLSFQGKYAYERSTDSLILPRLSPGIYLLEVSSDNSDLKVRRQLIAVSNLRLLWQAQPKGRMRLAVVRADNGQAVAGASVQCVKRNHENQIQRVVTDRNGEAYLTLHDLDRNNYWFYVSTPQDKALPVHDAWGNFNYHRQQEPQQQVRLFTDRAIYRPGQTVYVNLMAWSQLGTDTKATACQPVSLTLRDANGREVEQKTLTTDTFGTATTTFQLPAFGLTGRFSISSSLGYGRETILVEEYRRPTFEVTFKDYQNSYSPGDTLLVEGLARTYSGVALEGAQVSYSVVRRPMHCWRWWQDDFDEETVFTGHATTDIDGHFTARLPLMLPKKAGGFFQFELRADATDQAGESHQGRMSVPVGEKEALLSTTMPKQILDTENPTFTLAYHNALGTEVEATVRYGVFPTDDGLTDAERTAKLSLIATTNTPLRLPPLPSGAWTLSAVCGNDTLQHSFVLFSLTDLHPVVTTHDWFYQTSDTFPRDGQPVCIQLGSSDANQHIIYSVLSGDHIIENGRIDQSNALTLLKFHYKENYDDGLRLCFAWVYDGVIYTHSTTIARPLPEKKMQLSWCTFRDRLTPGQEETWTLEVRNPDGTPAQAQLMATLYDKSLDQLQAHRWDDSVEMNLFLPYAGWLSYSFGSIQQGSSSYTDPHLWFPLKFSEMDERYYEQLFVDADNVFYSAGTRMMRSIHTTKLHMRAIASEEAIADMAAGNALLKEATVESDKMELDSPMLPSDPSDGSIPVQLRENLEETAFFFPQLRTDEYGRVKLQFRLPESVTTWRLMGLAHDAEMRHGMISADIIAQKEVMVQPNLPRFLREGDQAIVSTRISNTSDMTQSGFARLQLLNPADESVVYEEDQPFTANSGQTVSTAFTISSATLESHEGLLIVRITAHGKDFSDGEQHYLPVLTHKKYVTTTLPFTHNETGTLSLPLKHLFQGKGIERPSLTVEYTNNPSWLVLQALPYVGDANEKNAISLSAAIFANTLGQYIVRQNPRLETIFQQWEQEEEAETTLQSQLEKNEQLKELLLAETPWVANAQSESAQRRDIAAYFHENRVSHTRATALSNLRKLQNANGSFSWWQGMEGCFSMTVAVTKTLVRLQAMTGKDSELETIITKAFRFLDKEVTKQVAQLKKWEKKGAINLFPSDALCDYLYTNALAQRSHTAGTDYLLKLMVRRPSVLTIYGKANIAVILAQYGEEVKARSYLKSLKEFTVYREEMGRYFDTRRAQYSWFNYRIPTQVAAIEALRSITPEDTLTLGEMRRWLLQEKRTQAWDTPFNAVEAIWAFADNGHISQLDDEDRPALLCIDGKSIEPQQATTGVGYVRHTESLIALPQTLTVKKSSSGTSWGAVYAQYLQPMSQVRASSSGITVRRELLMLDGKPVKSPKIGDRVRVHITVVADRDYDFVMVSDLRPACLEPVMQQSGYRLGYYLEMRDQSTRYFFHQMAKGKHVIETEYYIDREGNYLSGICTAQCAYAPEYSGRTTAETVKVTQ